MARDGERLKFSTEVAMCTAFIEAIDKRTWTPYAETAGWDILLVRRRDGFQIGVQAKLRFNVQVINQALESGYTYAIKGPGPDCRAVLVPDYACQTGLGTICDYLGVTVIRMQTDLDLDRRYNSAFQPWLPDRDDGRYGDGHWHELAPAKRCALPEYVPDGVAGAPSPIQLTDWKVKALKLCVLLDERGYVTRHDFAYLKLDHRRWLTLGWLRVEGGRFVADAPPMFKAQHPVVFEQIKADAKWRPAAALIRLIKENGI